MNTLGPIWTAIPAQVGPAAARIAWVAARQHGVITHPQLLAAGLSRSTIVDWVRAGHLHRLHRGVFAVGHPLVDRDGRFLAAVLACGIGAALSHGAAARHVGIDRTRGTGTIHVSVPRRSKRSPQGLLVHRPRYLGPIDLTHRAGVPTTTATRALFDQCSSLGPAALRKQFEQAEYLQLLDRARLHTLLAGATGRRGFGALRVLLCECTLPLAETRSGLERIIVRICGTYGLPLPAVNVPLLGYEVDFLWPEARLVVEADGGQHRGRQRDSDNERDVALGRAGYLVRRYSGEALDDEHAVATEILAILRERLPPKPLNTLQATVTRAGGTPWGRSSSPQSLPGLSVGLTSARAENLRFDTCVVESKTCQEAFAGGTFPQLRIIDTESSREKYSVCVKEIVGKQCCDGRMNRKGRDLIAYEPRAAGKATARWKVDGEQVGVWKYEIVLPGE